MPENTLVFTPDEAGKVKTKRLTDVYEFTRPLFKEEDICNCVTEIDIIPFAYVKILAIHRHRFSQILHFDAVAAGYPTLDSFKHVLIKKTPHSVNEETNVWHIIFELVK
ncbi:hypothetical protein [Phosphitispora sp. TUW77]|uniref:hypothetical protein n=1 Tax=Phosphitispora sp. TUW77 TaxID=3152361 RepID=UPI003AB28C16